MSERNRSPSRGYGNYGRSRSPHREYHEGHYGGRGYVGPGYGGWGLGVTSGLLLGTTLGAAINPYGYSYAYPYSYPYYGYPYGPVRYYTRPVIYV